MVIFSTFQHERNKTKEEEKNNRTKPVGINSREKKFVRTTTTTTIIRMAPV